MIECHVAMLFEGKDDLVGIAVAILKFLMMAAALQGVTGFDESGHLFVELMSSRLRKWLPSLLFGFKLGTVVLHKDYIFGVLNLVPLSIFLLRGVA